MFYAVDLNHEHLVAVLGIQLLIHAPQRELVKALYVELVGVVFTQTVLTYHLGLEIKLVYIRCILTLRVAVNGTLEPLVTIPSYVLRLGRRAADTRRFAFRGEGGGEGRIVAVCGTLGVIYLILTSAYYRQRSVISTCNIFGFIDLRYVGRQTGRRNGRTCGNGYRAGSRFIAICCGDGVCRTIICPCTQPCVGIGRCFSRFHFLCQTIVIVIGILLKDWGRVFVW